MKISKYIFGMAVAMTAMFTSCDTDNEGAIYNSDNAGLSFTASVLADVTVPATDPTFEVEIVRSNANEALTGSVTLDGAINKVPYTGELSATDYSFEPGEYKTTVTVDVTSLPIGQELALTISIDDAENVGIGGVASTSLTVSKEYNWVSLGMGTYTDNWGWGITYDVEIQKAEGFDRWRVVGPYKESEINDDGEWGNWLNYSSSDYVEFWLSDGIVYYNPINLGLFYQGDNSAPVYAYHPAMFSGIPSDHNKFLDDKTVQLAPYYYVPALQGGWNNTQEDGVIIITLP